MIQEKSYGVIPLRKKDNKWQVFLVKLKSGNHWGFPKGHRKTTIEDVKDASKREFKEETNLDIVRYLSNKIFEENYILDRNGQKIEKKVIYYLVEAEGTIKLQKNEIIDGGWFDISEAYKKITFLESKKICEEVIKFTEVEP